MKVIRTSILTGVTREKELNVTHEQLDRWAAGELVQNVFPHLTADEREFLMTGSDSAEWDAHFKNPHAKAGPYDKE